MDRWSSKHPEVNARIMYEAWDALVTEIESEILRPESNPPPKSIRARYRIGDKWTPITVPYPPAPTLTIEVPTFSPARYWEMGDLLPYPGPGAIRHRLRLTGVWHPVIGTPEAAYEP